MVAAQAPQELSAEDAAASLAMVPEKSQRSPAQRKVDARLLFAQRGFAERFMGRYGPPAPAFARAFLNRHVSADGGVYVVVKAQVSDGLLEALRAAGATGIADFPLFDTVTAVLPVSAVEAIAARDDVRSIGPRELFQTHRYFPTPEEELAIQASLPRQPKVGSANWEGVAAHQADRVHATGLRGAGTKVCVISDGVDSLAQRVTSGDLPGSVAVLSGQAGTGDEGTAMLELVHDIAPGATLGFATAVTGMAQFATNILNLRSVARCDVIVDDVSYFLEGAFQDDAIAQAVSTVTAAGALYFSAAGNSGSVTHGTAATYERDFAASAEPIPPVITALFQGATVTLHSFGTSLNYTTLTRATQYVALHWGERHDGAASDYDLVVTDAAGANILGAPGANAQSGAQDAVEIAYCEACTFPVGARVYVVKYSGQNRAIRLNAIYGRLAHTTPGSIYGHAATPGAIAVGAVDVRTASGGAFVGGTTNPTTLYSSDGPRKFFFTPTGAEITPGNTRFVTNGGVTVPKVDLVGSDCGTTSTPGFARFCGTSAAAPTVAAIAALVRSARPGATASQVEAALLASALDIEGAGVDRDAGAGIPVAATAARSLLANIMVAKDFTPAVILVGGESQLRVQLNNPNGVALSGIAFTSSYPSALRNSMSAVPSIGGAGCTGTLSGTPGGGLLVLTNGTVPANTVCSYTITVTGSVQGTILDGSGAVTTPIGLNSPPFSARLDVGTLPDAPTSVVAVAGNASITVSYAAPANTGGIPLVGFDVTCTPVGGGAGVSATVAMMTSTLVSPLVNGITYACTAAARNALGASLPAAASSPATPVRANQAITVTSAPPAISYVGGPGYTIVALSTGGIPIFSIAPASATVCRIASTGTPMIGATATVVYTAAGTCTIQVNVPLNDYFNAAPQVVQSVAVIIPTGLVANATAIAFGGQSMGTTSPARSVTVSNFTGAAMAVGTIGVTGPFVQANDCANLADGASCTVNVSFAPAIGAGAINSTVAAAGTLSVAGAAGPIATAALTGTAEKSLVTHYYRAILNRAPDDTGRSFWQGEAARLASLAVDVNEVWYVMAGYFFASPEYRAANKSDAAFVADLYRTFFNREPDGTGLTYWTGQVQGGLPREVVLFSFMFSPEFAAFSQGIFGNTAARPEVNLVLDFFRGLLNRLPDTPSLQYWVGRVKSAQCGGPGAVYTEVDAISSFFMFSPEYNQRARNNTQLVTDMYYSFLRRGGDAGGVSFWINQLQTGTLTADAVRRNFIASPEFAGRVNAVIAAGCVP